MRTGRAGVRADERGFTLLYVLILVVVVGVLSSAAARSHSTASRRDREEELLFRGSRYSEAIGRYYRFQNRNQFPRALRDLLKDPRTPATVRHLRREYADPVTGDPFEPIRSREGWVVGVRSTSPERPLKTTDFPPGLELLTGKQSYREWEFVYRPQPGGRGAPTGGNPGKAR
jgi:type II secretory pathway pseudopilin PulG